MELLLGCGNSRDKRLDLNGHKEWTQLVTLDMYEECKPDVLHDLDRIPYPFDDDTFDEVHAYEVLEHIGKQGDWISFFDHFAEIHRILKPNGLLYGTTPMWDSVWAWGDPGHTRIISGGSLAFLGQEVYEKEVGKSPMTDYRFYWKRNFKREFVQPQGETLVFCLRAIK